MLRYKSSAAKSSLQLLRQKNNTLCRTLQLVNNYQHKVSTRHYSPLRSSEWIVNCFQGLALPAALSFFRAMRVYPEPLQLVMILEKTLPEEMFQIVMDLMSRDVSESPTTATGSAAGEPAARGEKRNKRKPKTGTSSRGPPSEASSQEWDKVTEPDASIASLQSSTA